MTTTTKKAWDNITHTMTLLLKAGGEKNTSKTSEEKHEGNFCISQIPCFGCECHNVCHRGGFLCLGRCSLSFYGNVQQVVQIQAVRRHPSSTTRECGCGTRQTPVQPSGALPLLGLRTITTGTGLETSFEEERKEKEEGEKVK